MPLHFTHPVFLLLLVPALAWVIWLAWQSDVQLSPWRRWTSGGVRVAVLLFLVLALAGIQWMHPIEGLNVFFLLDRSDSIPEKQQERALEMVTELSLRKKKIDRVASSPSEPRRRLSSRPTRQWISGRSWLWWIRSEPT